MSENLESKHKVEALKSKILSSELKVFNGYVFNKFFENIYLNSIFSLNLTTNIASYNL